jgi:hypothetical protein
MCPCQQARAEDLQLGAGAVPVPPCGTGRGAAAAERPERELIDQLAQHRTTLERWQTTLTARTGLTAEGTRRAEREEDPFEPPRVSFAEALGIAARMVDQFTRLYLRTLRALQDQRRLAAPVVVCGAKQVNIGGQQVNLAR